MKGKKLSNRERVERLEVDKTERRKIFKELCDHVARGYSLDCFPPLSVVSIREYLKRYKEEFIQEELDDSMRKGKSFWEDIGHRQASGHCMGNSRTWYYNMSNRYGWREKVDIEAEHKGAVSINVVSYSSKKPSQDTKRDE